MERLADTDGAVMQVLVFSDVSVITEYSNFFPVLNAYGEREEMTRAELCEILGLTSGQAGRIFRDVRHLGLLDLHLKRTDLGRQWVKDVYLLGRPAPETVAQAAENVVLFKTTRRELPGEHDKKRLFTHFRSQVGPETRNQEIQSAVLRYLEAFFPKQHPVASFSSTPVALLQEQKTAHERAQKQDVRQALPRCARLLAESLRLLKDFKEEEIIASLAYAKQVQEK